MSFFAFSCIGICEIGLEGTYMKKIIILVIVLLITASIIPKGTASVNVIDNTFPVIVNANPKKMSDYSESVAEDITMKVSISAKSAVLMEAHTGKMLMSMNDNKQVYPASVTKIMAMLLVFEALESEKIKLDDIVITSTTAAGKGGSQIWLKEGESMTVHELLKATAIYSANDACTALGEYVAGSDEAFVEMMNLKAKELGMLNTHFDNCTGLDDTTETHLTTANDVAIMSKELLKYEKVFEYTTVWMDTLRNGATELVNTNKLVRFYKGTTGLKTGTTAKAGSCVSATAERDGLHLIAVVMGSDTSKERFDGAKAMLDWGFANYEVTVPEVDMTLITPVKVLHGLEQIIYPNIPEIAPVLITKGSVGKITQKVNLAFDVEAPVEAGQSLGKVSFYIDDAILCEYNLTAPQAVGKLNLKEALHKIFRSFGQ